jgi:hypothetical protein
MCFFNGTNLEIASSMDYYGGYTSEVNAWGLFLVKIWIDMSYTKEHGILCILFGCLDFTHIPDKMNIFIVESFYELNFEYEAPEGYEAEHGGN